MLLPNVCWHPPNCYPPNKDATRFVLFASWLCKRKREQIPFCTCQKPNKVSSSCYPPNQDATDLFYLLYGCANACLNKFPFAHTKTLSSSQLLPTNKDCACTPPEAELHKLRVLHSARTVHAQCTRTVHATVRGHNSTVNTMGLSVFLTSSQKTMQKYCSFLCFLHHFGANTWYLQRFVAVHCDVHCSVHCACTVRALCKTRCFCTLIFSSAEKLQFCFWRRGGTFKNSAPCKTHSV